MCQMLKKQIRRIQNQYSLGSPTQFLPVFVINDKDIDINYIRSKDYLEIQRQGLGQGSLFVVFLPKYHQHNFRYEKNAKYYKCIVIIWVTDLN